MTTTRPEPTSRTALHLVVGSLVLLVACSVMWGWLSGNVGWVALGSEAPMQFNTALGFALVGIGLLAHVARPGGIATRAAAVAVVVLGLATLCQYVLRSSFGLDELFVEHTVTTATPFPGRMAPATAFGFVLVGAALLVKASIRVAIGFAVLVLLALVLVDRWIVDDLLSVTPFTLMAPQTQILFALIGAALLVTPIDERERDDPATPRLAVYIGGVCLLTLLLGFWQELERDEWNQRYHEAGVALESLSGDLESKVDERGDAVWRMADRWSLFGEPERATWEAEARRYLEDFLSIDTMLVVEPDLTVRWQLSRDPSTRLLEGSNLGTDQGRLETFREALDQRRPQLMPFLDLRTGGRGTAYTVPVFDGERHLGFINASIGADAMLNEIRSPFFTGFGVALLDGSGVQAGALPASDDLGTLLVRETPLNVGGRDWRLAVWPKDAYLRDQSSQLPVFVLLFGLFAGSVAILLFKANQRLELRRRRYEEDARIADERFGYVARATSDVIWDWDLESDTVWWSAGLQSTFGFGPDDVGAGSAWRLDRIHPDDRDAVESGLRAAIDGGHTEWRAEYRLLDGHDQIRHVTDSGFVIRNDGAAVRVVGGIEDTTEQREAEERLMQAQKMDALGQLTGGVAHDFNNLLTVILGNGELLSEELADNADLRDLADMTVAAASRGAELTSRLLAYSRRQPLQPGPIDLASFVSGMESLLRRTVEAHVEIRLVLDEDPCVIEADEGQLQSAVLNLVLNARDAMPTGGRLTIETAVSTLDDSYVEIEGEGAAGEYAVISISDTGSGMPADVVRQVFEPFFTTKPKGRGTGLGLSMVHGFIKQSGGHIRIYSEPGEGTTVRIYLPLVDQPLRSHSETPAATAGGGDEYVLLVEDDEIVRLHVQSMLFRLGYRVSTAASGAEALSILEREPDVDLLFTDVMMPGGMNGRQLAERALAMRPGLRVLYTSGYTENAIVHHGRLDTGVQLLSKPYTREQLAAKLRVALSS